MYETKSTERKCQDLIDKFNNKSNKWRAKLLGFFTKNMSMYCKTIQIKERTFFGRSFTIDYWYESNTFDMEVSKDYDLKLVKEPIKLFEKVSGKEVQITRD